MRCDTHCPGQGSISILAAVVLVVGAAVAYSARAAITDVLVVLLGVGAVACAALAARVVFILRRDRGHMWHPGVLAARKVQTYRVTVVKPPAALSSEPSARAIEAPAYRIDPVTDRIEEKSPAWKSSSSS
jgi:hypothetical protein